MDSLCNFVFITGRVGGGGVTARGGGGGVVVLVYVDLLVGQEWGVM